MTEETTISRWIRSPTSCASAPAARYWTTIRSSFGGCSARHPDLTKEQWLDLRERYVAGLMARRAETKARFEVLRQERYNLIIEGHLTALTPERQQRAQSVINELTALWAQLSADEASLRKFVRAKRLGGF